MMLKPRLTFVAMALASALLIAPSGVQARIKGQPEQIDPNAAPAPLGDPEPQFPIGAQWSLTAVNGKPAPGDTPSFTIDDKLRATGFSGCNTYSMTLYPIRGQKLAAGAIAMTHRECDKDAMLLERSFLVTLHSLPVWSMDGPDLVVKTGATTLRFRRGF